MSRQTLDLGGPHWAVREALGETWRWYVAAPLPEPGDGASADPRTAVAPGWLPAHVPGSVVTDLHRAGDVPDPRYGRQSRAAEWTADRSWVYRRAVDVPVAAPGDRAVLELDGVDPAGEVFWDAGGSAPFRGSTARAAST